MVVFANQQIALDLGYSVNFKKKSELRKKIVEHGGVISYIITKKSNFVVTSDPEKVDISSKCRMALKYGLPVLTMDFIWDCLEAEKLLEIDKYVVGGKSKILDFKFGKISAPNRNQQKKAVLKKVSCNPRTTVAWSVSDPRRPSFDEEAFEVAKYAFYSGYNYQLKESLVHVIELQALPSPDANSDNSKRSDNDGSEKQMRFRITLQSGTEEGLREGKSQLCENRYTVTAIQALAVFGMVCEDLENKRGNWKFVCPIRGIGSPQLQRLVASMNHIYECPSEDVKELVEYLWEEAMTEVSSSLGNISAIKLEQVEKAEAILIKVRETIKTSHSDASIQTLIKEFYSTLPHSGETCDVAKDERRRWLARKQDMCQLVKDMISVNEITNFKTQSYIYAKYGALKCHITHLTREAEEGIIDLVKASLNGCEMSISNVYEVWRQEEDLDFRHDLNPKQLMFHSSKVENFIGIFSRGLLLPKVVVDDYGGVRSDAGMLGSGIYFASAASTSVKYSTPSKTKGSRLMLINEVALGMCKDYVTHNTDLTEPPNGFNSTHGVGKLHDKNSDFEHDEYVVYSKNQQRLRYLVEFTLTQDIVKPVEEIVPEECNIVSIDADRVEPEECNIVSIDTDHVSLSDVSGIKDPISQVKPGLFGSDDQQVELKGVHIRAKLIDLAAQVVVLQEYHNNSDCAIEAKYVFPLDDAAVVCGFEAFINGKHIVGEVKEKETAHKEYKKAISEGHGAYLMDQDEETPDVFIVSVGNLPPGARVLIKIIYVSELEVEDELVSFLLPASVAPWKEHSAMKHSTQDELKSHKMAALKTTVQVAVEMPFEIRSLNCPTHKVKIKQTASMAFIELAQEQQFGTGFQLLIGLAEIHVPRMWVERQPDNEDHQACMLTFYPEFEVSEDSQGEIIFVLDTSHSMKGSGLHEAKKVALLALRCIPTGWNFNVVTFGSDFEEVFPCPKPGTSDYMKIATQFIQCSSATKGSTDAMLLLRYYFLLPLTGCHRNVFIISDGHLQSMEMVMQAARKNSYHTRLFTCGVSSTCNTYALKALARTSGGAFEYFSTKTKSKWEPKLNNQMKKARQPGLTSVSVEWHQYDENLPPPTQAPSHIMALFNGSRLVVYGFVPNCTMATLRANVDGQEVSTVVSTSELSITKGKLVHCLAARAVIRDWEDGMLSADRTHHEVTKMNMKDEVISLSKEYSIVTQFTSFIAVERREENEKDLPVKGPTMEELVAKENVDILNYMGWTTLPVLEDLSFPSLVERLTSEIKSNQLSSTMSEKLDIITEKYMELRADEEPFHETVLTTAEVLTKALQLQGDTSQARNIAVQAFSEACNKMESLTVDDYKATVNILDRIRDSINDLQDEKLDTAYPLPGYDTEMLDDLESSLTSSMAVEESDSLEEDEYFDGGADFYNIVNTRHPDGGFTSRNRAPLAQPLTEGRATDSFPVLLTSAKTDSPKVSQLHRKVHGQMAETATSERSPTYLPPQPRFSPTSPGYSPVSPVWYPAKGTDKRPSSLQNQQFGASELKSTFDALSTKLASDFGAENYLPPRSLLATSKKASFYGAAPVQAEVFAAAPQSFDFDTSQVQAHDLCSAISVPVTSAGEASVQATNFCAASGKSSDFSEAPVQTRGFGGAARVQTMGFGGAIPVPTRGDFGEAPVQTMGFGGAIPVPTRGDFGEAPVQTMGFGGAIPVPTRGDFGEAPVQTRGFGGAARVQTMGFGGAIPVPTRGYVDAAPVQTTGFGSATPMQTMDFGGVAPVQTMGFGGDAPVETSLFGALPIEMQAAEVSSAPMHAPGICFSATPQRATSFGAAPVQTAKFGAAPVQTAKLGAAPVQTAKLGAAPVQTAKFGAAPVQTAKFGAAPVQTAKLGAAPVQTAKFGAAPVQTAKFGAAPVPTAKFGAAPVPTAKFGAAPVPTAKFGAALVQAAKFVAPLQTGFCFSEASEQATPFGLAFNDASDTEASYSPECHLAPPPPPTLLDLPDTPPKPLQAMPLPTKGLPLPQFQPPRQLQRVHQQEQVQIQPQQLQSLCLSPPKPPPPRPPRRPPVYAEFTPPSLPAFFKSSRVIPPPKSASCLSSVAPSLLPKALHLPPSQALNISRYDGTLAKAKPKKDKEDQPMSQSVRTRGIEAARGGEGGERTIGRTRKNLYRGEKLTSELQRITKRQVCEHQIEKSFENFDEGLVRKDEDKIRSVSRDRSAKPKMVPLLQSSDESDPGFEHDGHCLMQKSQTSTRRLKREVREELLTGRKRSIKEISGTLIKSSSKSDLGTRMACIRTKKQQLTGDFMQRLYLLQDCAGFWTFGPELNQLLGIDGDLCIEMLLSNGLASLGPLASDHIQKLLATLLVILSICELLLPDLFPLDEKYLINLSNETERLAELRSSMERKLKKDIQLTQVTCQDVLRCMNSAGEFCLSMDRQHPLSYSTLELGPNWVLAAASLLGAVVHKDFNMETL